MTSINVEQGPLGLYVRRVLDAYKSTNHYNMAKLLTRICKDLEGVPINIIQEAVTIYEEARDRINRDRHPHPSYFVAVAKRLADESSRAHKDQGITNSENIIWGKGI